MRALPRVTCFLLGLAGVLAFLVTPMVQAGCNASTARPSCCVGHCGCAKAKSCPQGCKLTQSPVAAPYAVLASSPHVGPRADVSLYPLALADRPYVQPTLLASALYPIDSSPPWRDGPSQAQLRVWLI